jgi:hypothetical protein
MRFTPTIFTKLLEPIDRRRFAAIVARHDGDDYDKSSFSWDHLVSQIFAQLKRPRQPSGAASRLERQFPAPLSPRQRCAFAFDPQ